VASVLNRTTKVFFPSVNTPDFPVEQWIHNPDMSAVAGQPPRYWTVSGDTVTLLDRAARDAVDAALLVSGREATVSQVDSPDDILRALVLVMLDEINTLRAQHSLQARTITQLRTAMRNKLGS